MECERKDDHCKNETVLGRKLQRESGEICWIQMTLMWISGESWKKPETQKGAQHLRPSAQMVQVSSWWSAARDGTGTKESGTHLGDKIRRPLQKGLEQQRVGWRSVEKGYLENCANMKVVIQVSERLMEPQNEEVSLRYILKYSTRGGSNIFQLCDTSEKHETTSWQTEKMFGESWEKRCTVKRVAGY